MSNFSNEKLLAIWSKAKTIEGKNPAQLRQDKYGRTIAWEAYGLESPSGWNVHHLSPQAKGGSNDLSNLIPLHWKSHQGLH